MGQVFSSVSSTRQEMDFLDEKEKYMKMTLVEKRSEYRCKLEYVTLENIPTWKESSSCIEVSNTKSSYQTDDELNDKISIFEGDITRLEVDCIVNAANHFLRGGLGVDGAIHKAAGESMVQECITLKRCETGEAKITGGYKLPAKYVIHTVGPVHEIPDLLEDAYRNSLSVAKENGLCSIAFPCVSTGVHSYPNKSAANIALKTVRKYLDENKSSFDRVIFCLFLPVDVEIYKELMPQYFPL